MSIPHVLTDDFDYDLPDERIAKYPLEQRGLSKLLVVNGAHLTHGHFSKLQSFLPQPACLVLNDTKVVFSRLVFRKEAGARIEIFCLEPHLAELSTAMQAKNKVVWKCMVGNLKRFKEDDVLSLNLVLTQLEARMVQRSANGVLIEFCWTNNISFSEILNSVGEVPLPPYLNRKPETEDKERYQTVYAKEEGAVAAPTAGLHFVEDQLQELSTGGIEHRHVTLHVSAGTFKPVKDEVLSKHVMHHEQLLVELDFLIWLKDQPKIIAVGTTSLRTLESLYWLALKNREKDVWDLELKTAEPYALEANITRTEALQILIDHLTKSRKTTLKARTALFTMPGYDFKMVDGLITNFHQPKSTLLALISGFIGEQWKAIYKEAIDNDYRFLSYGDSSLLIPKPW